jgi:hypothetical protein
MPNPYINFQLCKALRIWDVYSGSWIRILSILDPGSKFLPSRIRPPLPPRVVHPGFRGQKITGSRIRIRNTGYVAINDSLFAIIFYNFLFF